MNLDLVDNARKKLSDETNWFQQKQTGWWRGFRLEWLAEKDSGASDTRRQREDVL